MKLKVLTVRKEGGWNSEYVDLEVTEACDLVYYAVCDTTYTAENKISNKLRHTFWFPRTSVQKGDFVRLYTRAKRSTDQSSGKNGAGTTTHLFYWGLQTAVWNDEGDGVLLFQITTWKATRA